MTDHLARDTTCIGLRYFFENAAKKGVAIERLSEGVSYGFEHLNNPRERIDWENFARCCHNAERIWSDQELIDLGRKIIWHDAYVWVRIVMRFLYSTEEMYTKVFSSEHGQWKHFYPRVQTSIDKTSDGALLIRLALDADCTGCRALFLAQYGALISTPELVNLGEADVEMNEVEVGRRYHYRVKVPRGGGTFAPLRRALGWPFNARAAARELSEAHALLATRYEELERQVLERERIEKKMLQAQKLESLGVMAAGIAHDFNNLLVGIQGNAALALHRLEPASPARRFIEDIEAASMRSAELTRGLLNYAGEDPVAKELVNLSALARGMVQLLETAIPTGATLRCQLDEAVWVQADATQLAQVVMNLVTNAAESIGEGPGTVTIRTGRSQTGRSDLERCVVGHDLDEGLYAYCQVEDTGSGMDAGTLKKIFDPFFTTKVSGRGLGLAAVLGIAKSHGGALSVSSVRGAGTTFRLLLPEQSAPQPVENQAVASEVWTGDGDVLLVDDDSSVRMVTEMLLTTLGFHVVAADSGPSALRMVGEEPTRFRAAIVDASMPEMDGVETLHALRNLRRDLPALLMSGYSEETLSQRVGTVHSLEFLEKPFNLTSLSQKLHRLLEPTA